MNMMILGIIAMLAGVILMILGKLWALLLLLVGACLVIAHWARMFKGAGYSAPIDGGNIRGYGQQQSEVFKDKNVPQNYEDRPANK